MDDKIVSLAFARFKVWCVEREIPAEITEKFMFMGVDESRLNYQFKNCNTRNYLRINIAPAPFNL